MKRRIFGILFAVVLVVALTGGPAVAAKGAVILVPEDFATIQEAVDAASDGDRILVGPGEWNGAVVTKAVEIKGRGGAVINDGPLYGGPLKFGFKLYERIGETVITGSGATISHFTFRGLAFPIFAFKANNVTVEYLTLVNPLQGITNWSGNGWVISHNEIIDLRTSDGGGIGIFIGDYLAVEGGVNDSLVSHNKITGTLHVDPNDGGGYNGTGIVLYADFRWGALGAERITNNRVVKNKVGLVSDTPIVVDVVAIELAEEWYPASPPDPVPIVIHDNAIGFNDLRGTVLQIALTPENLDEVNDISRNLGNNRGHGLHPSAFGPGGN